MIRVRERLSFAFGLFLLAAIVLIIPSAARAQDPEKVFVGGSGGLTMGTVSGGQFAADAGVHITSNLAAFVEAGRMTDALPGVEQQMLLTQIATYANNTGVTPTLDGHMPVSYFLGGVRFTTPAGTERVSPFLEIGGGVGHVTNGLTASVAGTDVTSAIVVTPLATSLPMTKGLVAVGGGVTMEAAHHVGFDVGFRYSRVMVPDQALNISNIYGAIRIGF